jgi:hypothetical protein
MSQLSAKSAKPRTAGESRRPFSCSTAICGQSAWAPRLARSRTSLDPLAELQGACPVRTWIGYAQPGKEVTAGSETQRYWPISSWAERVDERV